MAIERIQTRIQGLDEQMEGGIPKNFIVLVSGPAGSMKSTITYNILNSYVQAKEGKALYISLEQDRKSLVEHMEKIGIKTEKSTEGLIVSDLTTIRSSMTDKNIGKLDWLSNILAGVEEHRDRFGVDLVAVDSMDGLYALSHMEFPRNRLFKFFHSLRQMGVTAILITETPQHALQYGKYEVEAFLADGIIHVDLAREGRNVGLYVSVVKMRKTEHARKYFPLMMQKGKLTIVTKD
jgi:KaiC/GvpD/RAD55 family RecA-like ATPase